jgi:hypothetical protein
VDFIGGLVKEISLAACANTRCLGSAATYRAP